MGRAIVHIEYNLFQWKEKLILIIDYNPFKMGRAIVHIKYNPFQWEEKLIIIIEFKL